MSLLGEREIRTMFGEFDCGCDNRKEIMGAANWQLDAGVIAVAVIATVLILAYLR